MFRGSGSFCVKRKVLWRYDTPIESAGELQRKADLHDTCTITINLLKLLGMVMTACVMLKLVGERTDAAGDPILVREDNMDAVSWVCRSGGALDKKGVLTHENAGAP